jgi:membrane-associated phospholipid phosphatase
MKHFLFAIFLFLLARPCLSQEKNYGDGPDDYLRFVPVAAALVLKGCGVESSSSWKRLLVNTATSYAIGCGITYGLKSSIHESRPDGTGRRSFPSGHAMVAFVGAAILDKEYRHVSPWISVAGYAVATGVAVDRVARNRHHWQDVAVGSAIGVGSTFLGYWLGDKITGEHSQYSLGAGPGGVSFSMRW